MIKPCNPRHALFLGLLLPFASCSGGGGDSSSVTPPSNPIQGTITVLSSSTCSSGPGSLPETTCMQLEVSDLAVPAVEVQLRVTEPDVGTVLRGTVVLGSGLLGTSFYADEAGGDALIPSLTAAGFRVIDRAWDVGWFSTGASITPQSERYATLITWIEANLHTGGAFCVTGNSAGAAEIGYALTSWQRSDIIDVALITSGPIMSRLGFLCEMPPDPAWLQSCRNLLAAGTLECGEHTCTADPGSVLCLLLPSTPAAGELQQDSILHPAATLDYPNTQVSILLGAQDCSVAVPMALLFFNAVSSQKSLQIIPATPHLVPSAELGRSAILSALINATGGLPAALSVTRTRVTEAGVEVHVEQR